MSRTILVVDDDQEHAAMVKVGLQQGGYSVTTAHNGPDALAQVASEPPGLILLDVEMPGMSGFEVLQQLKSNEATASIPILMLTGYAEIPDIDKSLNSGAVFHLKKPFTVAELLSLINNFPL